MSTKITHIQIATAKKELNLTRLGFNKIKRVTKQVRVSSKLHKKLKAEAKVEKKTISRLLDQVLIEHKYGKK